MERRTLKGIHLIAAGGAAHNRLVRQAAGMAMVHAIEDRALLGAALDQAGEDAILVIEAQDSAQGALLVRSLRETHRQRLVVLLAPMVSDRQANGLYDKWIAAVVRLLAAGADDVQPSTIYVDELRARLEALAGRRGAYLDHTRIALLDGTFDYGTGRISTSGGTVVLTRQESEVLFCIARSPGVIVSRAEIVERIDPFGDLASGEKQLDVVMVKIRRRLARIAGDLDVVNTVWGRGYVYVPQGFVPRRTEYGGRLCLSQTKVAG